MADNNLQAALDWLKSPQRTQQVQGIGNTLDDAINSLGASRAKDEALWNQAFGNPQKPLQVTDQSAFNEMTQRTMAGPMGFAPVGMVVQRGVTPELIARANQLLNINASPGRILQETGLVKTPTQDGFTWGKQISDAPLNIDFEKLKTTPYEGITSQPPIKVGDAITHPELFKLYPELQNMRLFKTDNQNAYYTNAGGGEIGIPSGAFVKEYRKDPEKAFNEIRSYAAHELSHAIQNLDNMPRGASIENFRGYGYQNVQKQADWTMKSLQDVTTAFLEKQGLTAPKDFKSFVQSVAYIKANGPKYLEDVGPESRKRIQAVLASDKSDDLLDTFSRVEKAYAKINTNKNKATARYKNEAGEAQARAVEKQYLENNYKAPITSFYDTPIENLQYRDPMGFTIK
jgi:hypothetical protein